MSIAESTKESGKEEKKCLQQTCNPELPIKDAFIRGLSLPKSPHATSASPVSPSCRGLLPCVVYFKTEQTSHGVSLQAAQVTLDRERTGPSKDAPGQ